MHYKKFIITSIFSLLATFSPLSSTPNTWSVPEIIDNTSSLVENSVITCYNSTTNQIFATWGDSTASRFYPTYSIASYSNGEWVWSNPSPIIMETGINTNVFTCFASGTNQIFASWIDVHGLTPTYSIASYSEGVWSWSFPGDINTTITPSTSYNVTICYDSKTNQVFATWSDTYNSNIPTYSIASYSDGNWTWSDIDVIPGTSAVSDVVYVSPDSTTNQIFATWTDNGLSQPWYSIASYSGSSWTWSNSASITTSYPSLRNVFSTYDSNSNQIFAFWSDNTTHYPTYSLASYSGGAWTWSTPATIATTSQVKSDIFSCYDSVNNQIFATWTDFITTSPIYSIGSNPGNATSWTAPSVIANTANTVQDYVCVCYNDKTNQIFATWADFNSLAPYFSIYTGVFPSSTPTPTSFVLYDLNRFQLIYEANVEEAKSTINK